MNQISINDARKRYGTKMALGGVSVTLQDGVYGVLGPNGAGKTTLIRALVSAIKLTQGNVTINNQDCAKASSFLGYLPQQFGLFQDLTVYEALELMFLLKKLEGDCKEEVHRVLALTNLEEEQKKKLRHLSGGMLRRVGIAQALLGNPSILIFDEPTAGLDPEERIRFRQVIDEIKENKIIIVSTHIVSDLESLCDKVLIMNHGKLLFNGTLSELSVKNTGGDGAVSSLEGGYLCVLDGK